MRTSMTIHWMTWATLALAMGQLLGIAPAASARSYAGVAAGPYGIHAARLAAQARAPAQTHGFEGLDAEEFPAIGTFTWEPYNRTHSAAFGMALRTQRHLQARFRGAVSGAARGDAGPLDAERPLGSYDEASGDHRRLVVAVQHDVERVPVSLHSTREPADLVAAVLARLEGKLRASLTLALRSRDGARVRPLLLTKAEKRGQYWECTFYDPHLQIVDQDAAGEPVSHVFGAPEQAGSGRFHQLRLPASGVGAPQVSHSWVATLDAHDQAGGAFAPVSDVAWLDLDWSQLHTVEHSVDAWAPGAGFDLDPGLDSRKRFKEFTFGGSDALGEQTGVELD